MIGNTTLHAHHIYDSSVSCRNDAGVLARCVATGTASAKVKHAPVFQHHDPLTATTVHAKIWDGFLKPGVNRTIYATDFKHARVETGKVVTFLNNTEGTNKVRRIKHMQMDGINSRFWFVLGDY